MMDEMLSPSFLAEYSAKYLYSGFLTKYRKL